MSDERERGLIIPSEAYPYLQMQRGAINDMRQDEAKWLGAYTEAIYSEFDCIEPHLPATCDAILDVGSGLGGINVLLARHFGDQVQITLLDGVTDLPFVEKHAVTFNHMGVARRFLKANGVENIDWIDANQEKLTAPRFFDLVVSFKSWCFHYSPARYLQLVQSSAIAGHTRLILDVRRDKPEWHELLRASFRHVRDVYVGTKFSTVLFEAR